MPIIAGKYYTEREVEKIRDRISDEAFEKFLISGVIGYATGSTVVGSLIGGSIMGALLGDVLEGTDDSFL